MAKAATQLPEKLTRLLHTQAANLEFLGVLDEDAQQQLLTDIERAHAAHGNHIHKKMEEALGHLPWLIRGPIKKMFGI